MYVAPLYADYTPLEQSCAERSKNLRLGQSVAAGCEQYDPHRTSGSSDSSSGARLVNALQFEVGAAFVAPRSDVGWQIGPVLGAGWVFGWTWGEFGISGRALVAPRDERTVATTLSMMPALRVELSDVTLLRFGVGVGFGPWWIGDRNAAAHADFETFVHLASRSDRRGRLRVGPLIRATHTWALPYREDTWILTVEVGITY